MPKAGHSVKHNGPTSSNVGLLAGGGYKLSGYGDGENFKKGVSICSYHLLVQFYLFILFLFSRKVPHENEIILPQ